MIALRRLEERDIPLLTALFNNERVVRWMGDVTYPLSEAAAKDWLSDLHDKEREGRPAFFAIAQSETDLFVGGLGVDPVHNTTGPEGDFEIGFWVGEPYWRQGIALAAVKEVLRWAAQQDYIKRIVALTDEDNLPSQDVLKKAGFAFCGLRPRLKGNGSSFMTYWTSNNP